MARKKQSLTIAAKAATKQATNTLDGTTEKLKAFSTHCQLCGEEILDEEAFYFDDGSYFIRGYCIHQVCAEEQTPNMPGYTKLRNEMRENMTLINPLQEKDSVKNDGV